MNEDVFEKAVVRWRTYVERHGSLPAPEIDELEERLNVQASQLLRLGLTTNEAFQVAVRRISRDDAATRAFALEHARQLIDAARDETATDETATDETATDDAATDETVTDDAVIDETGIYNVDTQDADSDPGGGATSHPEALNGRWEIILVLCLAAGAALAIKIPSLFGYAIDDDSVNQFYFLNASFFVFPFLTAYFAWKRRMNFARWSRLAPPFLGAIFLCNVFPFKPGADTAALTGLHAPVALWLVVGYAYAGGDWRVHGRRMDFVRFSGQLFILFVLIALGGGVLTGITLNLFNALGLSLEWAAATWIIPCGAMGAVIVAAWLVETGQGAIEQVAPVLTRIFTPLFTLMLLSFLAVLVWTGKGIQMQREMLIAFDILLIVVVGLVLYSISARNPQAPPGVFDGLLFVLILAAVIVDILVLAAMTARITEFGFTPNRVCALGLNVILFVNLAWTARLYIGFLRDRGSFSSLERWQTAYLPVFAAWAAFVVALFPILFGFN